jgi:hypothetical protein
MWQSMQYTAKLGSTSTQGPATERIHRTGFLQLQGFRAPDRLAGWMREEWLGVGWLGNALE